MRSMSFGLRSALVVSVVALVSCTSTTVKTVWQDPAATRIRFTKVLSLAITKDRSLREATEGELCRHMPLVECKPAAYAIPDSMNLQVEEAKALTRKEGFDGAVVVRVLEAGTRVTYVPPQARTFWGYYGYAWPMVRDPGYYREDQVLLVETSIFSLARDEMIWVGTSETVNPQSLPELIDDFAKAVRGELVERDLIPPT